MSCQAVINGEVKQRGKPSIEFYYAGRPYYYCYGYIDRATEELIETCKNCKSQVEFAQKDYELLMGE